LAKMDRTPGHPLESHLLMDRVGAHGFSFGGAVSAEFGKEDPRVRGIIGLDAVVHGVTAKDGLDKPVLFLDTPWMVDPLDSRHSWLGGVIDPALPWAAIVNEETPRMWKGIANSKVASLSRYGGFRLLVEGMHHFDFTDRIFMSPLRRYSQAGSLPPKRVAAIVNAYTSAFFQQILLDIPSPLLMEESQLFSEATLQIWRPSEAPVIKS
jgi:hypothetical protein